MPISRKSSQARDRIHIPYISCIGRQVLYYQYHPGSLSILYIASIRCICQSPSSNPSCLPPSQMQFFFSCFLFFNLIFLYSTVLVLPYINMNLPRVYMSSQSRTPLPPTSPYHLSGSSQCTSSKHPASCIEPRLAIHFLHDIIRFNAILPNHPTLSLSHRVQKTVKEYI